MDHSLPVFLLLILVLLLTAKGLEALFGLLRLPAAGAGLLAGMLWGPGLAGRIWPGAFSSLFGPRVTEWFPVGVDMQQMVLLLGAFLFCLDLGMDINLPALGKQRRRTLRLFLWTFALPFLVLGGIAVILILTGMVNTAPVSQALTPPSAGQPGLFSGSFARNPILASFFVMLMISLPSLTQSLRLMKKVELLKTDLGLQSARLLSATMLLSFPGLSLVLVLAGPVSSDPWETLWRVFLISCFLIAVLSLGRLLMDRVFRLLHKSRGTQTRANETALAAAALSLALLCTASGIPVFLGVFLAGVICASSRFLDQQTQEGLRKSAQAVLVPLFFALAGFGMDPVKDLDLPLTLAIMGVVILARVPFSFAGGRILRLRFRQAVTLSLLHLPGGEVQLLFGMLAMGAGLVSPGLFLALSLGTLIPGFLSEMLLQGLIFHKTRARIPGGLQRHIHEHSPDLEGLSPRIPRDQQGEFLARPGMELVLRTLCYDTEVRKRCDPETTLMALLEREEAFSTALGRGLAVPHAEIPGLAEFTVFAARSETALDWNSPDGEGTRVFVLILIPPGRTPLHLQFLKHLARTWSRQEVRTDCLTCLATDFSARLKFWMDNQPGPP